VVLIAVCGLCWRSFRQVFDEGLIYNRDCQKSVEIALCFAMMREGAIDRLLTFFK
jgi:hypothetical protein